MIFYVISFAPRALRFSNLLAVVSIGCFMLIDSGNLLGQSGQRGQSGRRGPIGAGSSSKMHLDLTPNATADTTAENDVVSELTLELPMESGPEIVSESEEFASFEPRVDVATSQYPICNSCDTSELSSLFPDESVARIAVVKNRHLFGDPDKCCDEWKGFCKMKKLSTDCPCGGFKAKPGHWGLPWLRSGEAGEDCDYREGGCCESGGCKRQTNGEIRRNVLADAIANFPRFRRDCTCSGGDHCDPKEGCQSCQ